MTHDADELVYPMRLSQHAEVAQEVRLHLLADHRMERTDDDAEQVPAEVAYAGWIDPGGGSVSEDLAGIVGEERVFLTTMDHAIAEPETITAEFTFGPAAEDTEYRQVERVDKPVYILGIAGGPFLVLVGVMVVGASLGTALLAWKPLRAGSGADTG